MSATCRNEDAERPGRTVLVVEDEDSLRAVIRRLLQSEGFCVLEAQNGATALEVLKDAADHRVELVPHLVVLAKPFRNKELLATIKGQLEPSP